MFSFEGSLMKSKRLIRFYFAADNLNRALDNLITYNACNTEDFERGGGFYADKIIRIIGVKSELTRLWGYLDGVMGELNAHERDVLEFYGGLRVGIKKFPDEKRREIKRVVVKFTRHARFIDRYGEGLKFLKEYYCLL